MKLFSKLFVSSSSCVQQLQLLIVSIQLWIRTGLWYTNHSAIINSITYLEIQVLSKGHLKEFDSPYFLLQNPQSTLYSMVKETGPTAAQKLHQMALKSHHDKEHEQANAMIDVI